MTELSEIWDSLQTELASRGENYLENLGAAWANLDGVLQNLSQSFRADIEWHWEPGKLESLADLFETHGSRLLFDPVTRLDKTRPQQRVLEAAEEYRNHLEDLLRQVPEQVQVSGRELAEVLSPANSRHWRRYWLAMWAKPQPLALRAAVRRYFHAAALRRARVEGRLLLGMAQASLAVLDPWEVVRDEALLYLSGGEWDLKRLTRFQGRWQTACAKRRQRSERALEGIRTGIRSAPAELGVFLLQAPRSTRQEVPLDRLVEYTAYWSRQCQAVSAQHDLDVRMAQLGREVQNHIAQALDSLETEHRDLLSELTTVKEWLQTWETKHQESFPPAKVQLISAEERARNWSATVLNEAGRRLPPSVETVEPSKALPGWRGPWRQIRPLTYFESALRGATDLGQLPGLTEAEGVHRAMIREIERAREVVTYSLETAQAESESAGQIAREGVDNALKLILYRERKVRDVAPLAEAVFVEAAASAFSSSYTRIEAGRFGLLTRLVRQRGRRLRESGLHRLLSYARLGAKWFGARLLRIYHWGLVQVGWEHAPEPRREHVTRRPYLEQSRLLDSRGRDLPMIYHRLFRLEPVQDPRFLVGREVEMAALAEARDAWLADKGASLVLVGERGSGKTSLLNCALVQVLPDTRVLRASFRERVRGIEQMQRFLREQLEIPGEKDLREALTEEKRVFILEEIERTFLRAVDGLEATRYLLSLISDTNHQTLWILCLNQVSFRFLDAALGMGRYFSHRINAMSVEPENLEKAIMLRHNLSGLRLRFARPLSRFPLLDRFRRPLGLQRRSREIFLDALYRQSEGVFRAAFELWHGQIDTAHGGVLYMKSPAASYNSTLVAGLNREDLFTLRAVLQHGSLTADEHAAVFGSSEPESRDRLESLIDRGVLEAEPQAPGWRVPPEAGYVVRKALDAQNLL